MFRWSFPPLTAVLLALAAGCSGKSGAFGTVSGVVTHNGNPVEGAQVIFHSTAEVDGKQGKSYSSLTDSSGKYLIAATESRPGLPAGVYKVTVTKYEGKAPTAGEGMDAGQLDAQLITPEAQSGSGAKGGPVNLLPKEYATPATTKLSATVDVGRNENVNFALKGK